MKQITIEERFKKKFPHLFDLYIDRGVPGSFSEGENLLVFFDEELSLAKAEWEEELWEKAEKVIPTVFTEGMFFQAKNYSNEWAKDKKERAILSLLSSSEDRGQSKQEEGE